MWLVVLVIKVHKCFGSLMHHSAIASCLPLGARRLNESRLSSFVLILDERL